MARSDDQDRIIESIALSPVAMVLSNPRRADNPLEVVNAAFCELTGYSEKEILGRNCRFLSGEATDEAATKHIRLALQRQQPVLTDILNYRRDGTPFRNGVMITPIYNGEAELVGFLGSQVDLGPGHAEAFARRCSGAAERITTLSPRQRLVLQAMTRGLRNKQIAWALKISQKTVETHRALLIQRLEVGTSAEAIRVAVEAGL